MDDALQGQGVYTHEDGGVLTGTYVDGELNGFAQEVDGEGRMVFKGQYKDDIRCGECWVYHPVSDCRALRAPSKRHDTWISVCGVLWCFRMGAVCLGR